VLTIRAGVLSLGLTSLLFSSLPVGAQTLAGGVGHSVVLKNDGTVWTFGLNNQGQIGDNTVTTRSTPVQVTALSGVTVTAVAAGAHHTLALTSTGTLYVWGDNAYGQVGDSSTTDRKVPVQSSLTNVIAIAAGEYHSLALTSAGAVYTWGRNANGQLGTGNTTQATSPQQVLTGVAAIGAGFDHSLFVKTDGTAWAVGLNSSGQLGDASTTQRTTAVQMSGVSGAVAAAGGERHSVILLSDGTLKASGYNASGQVGDASTTQRTAPVAVSTLTSVVALAVGADHALVRKSDDTVWAWGANSTGALGDGTSTTRTSPVQVTTLSGITKIGTGHDHSLAVTSTGIVYSWGANGSSQLGDGTTTARSTPLAISDVGYDWLVATPTLSVASGTYTTDRTVTVAVATSGATIRYTRTGVDPTESDATVASGSTLSVTYSQTLKVKAWKAGMPASQVNAAVYEMKVAQPTLSPSGGSFTAAQTVTMTTATPGATLRYTTDGSTPTPASTAYTSAITVSTSTTLKVIGFKTDWSDSDLRTGTYNMNFGTLAAPTVDPATGSYTNSVAVTMSALAGAAIRYTTNNTAVQSTSPLYTEPLVLDVTTTVRARAYHPDYTSSAETTRTYTLAAAAPVFSPTAGTYAAGQLITVTAPSVGSTIRYTLNGAEPTSTDPIIASGDTLVVGQYTLKAKAWKTGAQTSTTAAAAYAVTGTIATARIVAGDSHTLAIRGDGVVWAWGTNSSGQGGQGHQLSPQPLPTVVSGTTGAAGVAAGDGSSFARRSSGAVHAWGYNQYGRLGDGSTTTRLLPVTSGATDVTSIAAGLGDHTLAVKTDGTVLAWGGNSLGQLGDGSTTIRTTPVAVSGLSSVVGTTTGNWFSVAVKQDGSVWAWGRNAEYQLGNGGTTNSSVPVQVSGITTATAVSAGIRHTLARLSDGTVVGWGVNNDGAIGDGTTTNRSTPVAVAGLTNVVAIAAGSDFSLALDNAGTVWSWGTNGTGQLGDGGTTERWSPAAIGGLTDIVQITAGSQHALALASDGTVWAWGRNYYGQLGDGTTTDRLSPVAISGPSMAWRVATPTLSLASGQYAAEQTVTVAVADPDATLRYTTTGVDPTASDATVANGATLAVTQSQTVKVSGWKTGSPTSVVTTAAYELKAVAPAITPGTGAYASAQSVTLSTTTGSATIRYTTDGTEPTAGSTPYAAALSVAETGTLKARTYRSGWTPSESTHASYWISAGTVATPTTAPAGGAHSAPVAVTLATSTAGATIRYTLDGTAPTGQAAVYLYPFLVSSTTTVKAQAFKAGHTPSGVTTTTYDIDAAGATATPAISPAGGRFATAQTVTITGPGGATLRYTTDGTEPTTSSPTILSGATLNVGQSQIVKVRAWSAGLDPSAVRRADFLVVGAIGAGGAFSTALRADGTVWAWGGNAGGQVGDGTTTTRLTPVQVLTGVTSISAGDAHTLATKADGTLWAWGSGATGKLGTGTTANRTTPTQIVGFTDAVAVAASYHHSLVLKGDGTVWAFGANQYGEIGDGTTTTRMTPVQVAGLSGVVAIAAGQGASYALQSDGAAGGLLWAWGHNAYGQLGDGSLQPRLLPTRVIGVTAPRAVAAGRLGAFALDADGRVFSWGLGTDGQLGTGSTAPAPTPTAVAPITRARLVAAGSYQAFALDRVARTLAWGANSVAQLGFGETSNTSTFVPTRSDLSDVLGLASGHQHTLVMMPDGSVRGVGLNEGRLGNGATGLSVTPVVVSGLMLATNSWLTADPDADGLRTWREYFLGTDPLAADTNGNGLHDGAEEAAGLDAAHPDTDGDGVRNEAERAAGTDPFRADTDGDGHADGVDAFPLDPTRWDPPIPGGGDTTPPVITLKEPVSACPVPCPL